MYVDNLDSELQRLVKSGDWNSILKLGEKLPNDEKHRYLWTWPTLENLKKLGILFKKLKIRRVLSIGCGSGLLEWLIEMSLGIDVYGLEVDRSWWESSYSPTTFIKLNYIENNDNNLNYMQTYCETKNWNFALLFCYFNNRSAFLDYMKHYKGSCVIIIGPGADTATHTDPSPVNPFFDEEQQWKLMCSFEIDTNKNVLAIYVL